jgi:hypothetical protein
VCVQVELEEQECKFPSPPSEGEAQEPPDKVPFSNSDEIDSKGEVPKQKGYQFRVQPMLCRMALDQSVYTDAKGQHSIHARTQTLQKNTAHGTHSYTHLRSGLFFSTSWHRSWLCLVCPGVQCNSLLKDVKSKKGSMKSKFEKKVQLFLKTHHQHALFLLTFRCVRAWGAAMKTPHASFQPFTALTRAKNNAHLRQHKMHICLPWFK